MLYFATQLYSAEAITIDERDWKQLGQQIEQTTIPAWKVWVTADTFRGDDVQIRVFSVNGHWKQVDMVYTSVACYLSAGPAKNGLGDVITIVSSHQKALEKLIASLSTLYDLEELESEVIKPSSLKNFLQRNRNLLVQSASLVNPKGGKETLQTYSKPISIEDVEKSRPHWEIQTVSALVNLNQPPVKVQALYLNLTSSQIGLTLASSQASVRNLKEDELKVIGSIFKLANRVFDGNEFSSKEIAREQATFS